MQDRFIAKACRALVALDPPSRILLAVSGGADSMALLDAILAGRSRPELRGTTFVVGHFDHRLRPGSAAEAALVEQAALERGCAFSSRVAADWEKLDGGLEEAARHARYEALREMAAEHLCGAVVTAHTATDQAETLLWNLARGAGRRGLGAMRPRRTLRGLLLLRPLLGFRREETRAWCERRGVPFADDPTNAGGRPRARIRARITPVMEELAPGAVRRLAATATRLRAEEEWLDAEAARLSGAGDERAILRALPPVLRHRALIQWVERQRGTRRRLTSTHVAALDRLLAKGHGRVDLPATRGTRLVATVTGGRLVLETLSALDLPGGGRRLHSPSDGAAVVPKPGKS